MGVSAENNPQMLLYALGALDLFDALYDIEKVPMTIFQPRKFNISSKVKSVKELKAWAESEIKAKVELAFKDERIVTYWPWMLKSMQPKLI